jgi:hypothetical protein
LFVIIISIVGLISEVVGIVQQTPVQRGIDEHTVTLVGTYSDLVDGRGKFSDDTYVLTYTYEGQEWQTELRGLPGRPTIGDRLCVEIDATQPQHGRVCGTRGGLGDAESGLIWGGSFIAGSIAYLVFAWWWMIRRVRYRLLA